jgi:hypothetical protein
MNFQEIEWIIRALLFSERNNFNINPHLSGLDRLGTRMSLFNVAPIKAESF